MANLKSVSSSKSLSSRISCSEPLGQYSVIIKEKPGGKGVWVEKAVPKVNFGKTISVKGVADEISSGLAMPEDTFS